MILLLMTIGLGTATWMIAAQAFFYGVFSSIPYICINTLAFADLDGMGPQGSSPGQWRVCQQTALKDVVTMASTLGGE